VRDLSFDPAPLCWALAGAIGAFTLYVFLLLPFALFSTGPVGDHARSLLRDLFRLFHALIDAFSRRDRK
jgi:hypothetical protein